MVGPDLAEWRTCNLHVFQKHDNSGSTFWQLELGWSIIYDECDERKLFKHQLALVRPSDIQRRHLHKFKSYHLGASLLQMMESVLGPDAIHWGMSNHRSSFQVGNVREYNILLSLEEAVYEFGTCLMEVKNHLLKSLKSGPTRKDTQSLSHWTLMSINTLDIYHLYRTLLVLPLVYGETVITTIV